MADIEFVWIIEPEVAFPELLDWYADVVYQGLVALAHRYAAEIEAWMKANAPWTDRTGNLRRSLYAEVLELAQEIVLGFDYGLDYGVYLEFSNQGRFAVIAPALDHFGPRIWADVQALVA